MELLRELKVHPCADGGILYEFVKEEGFGQLTIRTVLPGVFVGDHLHPITNEWWLIVQGEAMVYLESPDGIRVTYSVSGQNPKLIHLPAGTGHGIKNVGDEDVIFIFFADRLYDPKTHDKEPWSWE